MLYQFITQIAYTKVEDTDIHFTIPDPTFLEMLLLNIRGNTIKYSYKLKKQSNEKEDKLIKETEYLKGMSNNDNANLITSKKMS